MFEFLTHRHGPAIRLFVFAAMFFTAATASAQQSLTDKAQEGNNLSRIARKWPANRSALPADPDAKGAVQSAPQPAPPGGWKFAVTPYLFAAGLNGQVGARGVVVEVDESFGSILDRLDLGFMAAFEARKGDWVFVADTMYVAQSQGRESPGQPISEVEVKSTLFLLDLDAGYRVTNVENGVIDLYVGARYWNIKNTLTLKAGQLSPQIFTQREDWADPIFGWHGNFPLSRVVFLIGKFDIGGFGVSSSLTGQALAGVGANLKPRVALIAGYRYLYVNYSNSGFTFKVDLSGPVFGAKFRF